MTYFLRAGKRMNWEMWWFVVFRPILILWGGGAVIGVLLGLWARTPMSAFFCGAVTGAVGAGLLINLVYFRVPRSGDYLCACVVPAMVAGLASARIRTALNSRWEARNPTGQTPLSPKSEAEARSHFIPSRRSSGSESISQPDGGMRRDERTD